MGGRQDCVITESLRRQRARLVDQASGPGKPIICREMNETRIIIRLKKDLELSRECRMLRGGRIGHGNHHGQSGIESEGGAFARSAAAIVASVRDFGRLSPANGQDGPHGQNTGHTLNLQTRLALPRPLELNSRRGTPCLRSLRTGARRPVCPHGVSTWCVRCVRTEEHNVRLEHAPARAARAEAEPRVRVHVGACVRAFARVFGYVFECSSM